LIIGDDFFSLDHLIVFKFVTVVECSWIVGDTNNFIAAAVFIRTIIVTTCPTINNDVGERQWSVKGIN